MKQQIAHVAVLVENYDDAIEFYTKKLGFRLIEDSSVGPEKRWVVVGTQGSPGCSLLLAKASTREQQRCI